MTHAFFPLAIGFGNLAMLGWLAVAAAPLLIHLWSRHRHREAPWAAMQFLLAAMRKNARRMQIQQWLLLAVRTLIIVLVVLAVAEPYGAGFIGGVAAPVPTHKVLVLDTSFSMAYRDGESTRFERTKKLAGDLVRSSPSGDTFSVIALAEPARLVLGRDVIDRIAVVDQISALPQTYTGADLVSGLVLVDEALERNESDPRGLDRQEVYFFTDLQRRTWQAAGGSDARESECGRLWDALAKKALLTVVDVGTPDDSNLAATELTIAEPFVTVGREIALVGTLRQFGSQPRPGCKVELVVDGVPVGEQTVDVPAGGEATVRFAHRFASSGSYGVALHAAGDRLEIDDLRALAVAVEERVRVLCVAGREGAARYVAKALNPDPASESEIEAVVVSEAELEELELADFDGIFFCNVSQLTPNEAARLARYAAHGGGLVFFLGDRVLAERYNALAANTGEAFSSAPQDGASILPVRLGPVAATKSFGVDPLDYRHAIVAPFRGRERAGLLTTPVSRYFRLELPQNGSDTEVVAALAGGDPLIVAAPLGRGRVVIVATDGSLASVDPASGEPWTNWPTWPSFLPIVREMLVYAVDGRKEQRQQPVGTPLGDILQGGQASLSADGSVLPTPSPVTRASRPHGVEALQIVRPDGRSDPVSMRWTREGLEWSYDDTDINGFFALRGAPAATQQFAVNVDTSESDLTKIDSTELPEALRLRDAWRSVERGSTLSTSARTRWTVPLLWSALGLMLVESFLAWQFGRGAA